MSGETQRASRGSGPPSCSSGPRVKAVNQSPPVEMGVGLVPGGQMCGLFEGGNENEANAVFGDGT